MKRVIRFHTKDGRPCLARGSDETATPVYRLQFAIEGVDKGVADRELFLLEEWAVVARGLCVDH